MVTMRVDELASAAALKPSRMARRDAKRKTAMATLNTVSAVRRLLRRALFRISPMNFMSSALSFQLSAHLSHLGARALRLGLLDEGALLQMEDASRAFGRMRVVGHHHDRLLEFG